MWVQLIHKTTLDETFKTFKNNHKFVLKYIIRNKGELNHQTWYLYGYYLLFRTEF